MEYTPKDIDLQHEDHFITTDDEVNLNAWYISSEKPKSKIILYCHGNSGNISHRLETVKIFHDLGLNVFVFDYRGYGKSKGKPNESGTYQDVKAAWDFLINAKKCRPSDIIIFGRSLGGAIAIDMSTRVTPAKVILESTFTSTLDMTRKLFPLFSVGFLIKNKYFSLKKVPNIQSPVLVIHSPEDKLVPFEHGKMLYNKLVSGKCFLKINGNHNEGFLETGEKYIEGLRKFIFS